MSLVRVRLQSIISPPPPVPPLEAPPYEWRHLRGLADMGER